MIIPQIAYHPDIGIGAVVKTAPAGMHLPTIPDFRLNDSLVQVPQNRGREKNRFNFDFEEILPADFRGILIDTYG